MVNALCATLLATDSQRSLVRRCRKQALVAIFSQLAALSWFFHSSTTPRSAHTLIPHPPLSSPLPSSSTSGQSPATVVFIKSLTHQPSSRRTLPSFLAWMRRSSPCSPPPLVRSLTTAPPLSASQYCQHEYLSESNHPTNQRASTLRHPGRHTGRRDPSPRKRKKKKASLKVEGGISNSLQFIAPVLVSNKKQREAGRRRGTLHAHDPAWRDPMRFGAPCRRQCHDVV